MTDLGRTIDWLGRAIRNHTGAHPNAAVFSHPA
jgi:hypothetical protein